MSTDRKRRKQLISAEDFDELKIKIYWIILWLVICFHFHLSTYLFLVATGVLQLLTYFPEVPFLSLLVSLTPFKVQTLNSLHPVVHALRLVSSQKQLQLRPFWPTSRQYPFQSPLKPFFYFLSHRHWSVFAHSVKLRGGNTHGEVSVPLCLNAWEVTYLEAEKGKMVGVESQFCFSLSGQYPLLNRKEKNMNEACLPLFPSFSPFCHSADPEMDVLRFLVKSIPIHGSYSMTPNRKMRVHWRDRSPSS